MRYKEKICCRVCGSDNLRMILDLHDQPLANSYHDGSKRMQAYPLKLNLCEGCWHSQLSVVVDPDEMYKNYLYVSGTTATLREYFEDFYHLVESYTDRRKGKVLDIACNDGSQLEVFKRNGWETYGIDPAENIYEISKSKGFTRLVCDYFGEESARCLGETLDVIVAQNVFAHTDDIHDFLRVCKKISKDGTRLFIQTSQSEMFANGEFDTIYHEHLSFFCANSMKVCAERNGWYLEDVRKTDIHGTSYVFVLSSIEVDCSRAERVIEKEREEGKMSVDFYESFARKALEVVGNLANEVRRYREMGYRVIGYGAAAKAMTLLNFGKIELEFIVDDNPMKHGLVTPGMDIPIVGPEILSGLKGEVVIVPLAWNFSEEIRRRVTAIRGDADIYIGVFG